MSTIPKQTSFPDNMVDDPDQLSESLDDNYYDEYDEEEEVGVGDETQFGSDHTSQTDQNNGLQTSQTDQNNGLQTKLARNSEVFASQATIPGASATPNTVRKDAIQGASATPNTVHKDAIQEAFATPNTVRKDAIQGASATPNTVHTDTIPGASATPNTVRKDAIQGASATPNTVRKDAIPGHRQVSFEHDIAENLDALLAKGNCQTEAEHKWEEDVERKAANEEETRKKRGLPKTLQVNQQRYAQMLERQNRMLSSKKDKKKGNNKAKQTSQEKISVNVNKDGMRRVNIGGKVRFLPVKSTDCSPGSCVSEAPVPEKMVPQNLKPHKKMDNRKEMKSTREKKVPAKYAKQIELDIKKQTIKNVKTFTDLRRVKALENIQPDPSIDMNHASINELRKLRVEQRKYYQEEAKKHVDLNKRESVVQEILKNDKLSKFGKVVAIRNLSAASRHKKQINEAKNEHAMIS